MKKLFAALFIIYFTIGTFSSFAQTPPLEGEMSTFELFESDKDVSQLEFLDINGQPMTLSSFEGKVVLLNFWATWCPPCIDEMPSLDELQSKLSEEGLEVVALSFDRLGPRRIEKFFKRYKLDNLRVYLDDHNLVSKTLDAYALPTTFVINREGKIIGKYSGPANWASDEAINLLRHYLGKGNADESNANIAKEDPTLKNTNE